MGQDVEVTPTNGTGETVTVDLFGHQRPKDYAIEWLQAESVRKVSTISPVIAMKTSSLRGRRKGFVGSKEASAAAGVESPTTFNAIDDAIPNPGSTSLAARPRAQGSSLDAKTLVQNVKVFYLASGRAEPPILFSHLRQLPGSSSEIPAGCSFCPAHQPESQQNSDPGIFDDEFGRNLSVYRRSNLISSSCPSGILPLPHG